MKIALTALVIVVALIAVVLTIGATLPKHHSVSRSIIVRGTPADTFAKISNFANAPKWRRDVVRVEMLPPVDGKPRFREFDRHRGVTYEVVERIPPHHLVTRIADTNLGYSGTWTYDVTPENGATPLTIREDADVTNVFFRFMSRFVIGHTATIDRYLRDVSGS